MADVKIISSRELDPVIGMPYAEIYRDQGLVIYVDKIYTEEAENMLIDIITDRLLKYIGSPINNDTIDDIRTGMVGSVFALTVMNDGKNIFLLGKRLGLAIK